MSVKPRKYAATFAGSAYRLHERQLRRFLMRRLRNSQDARDIAQEVWARLLRVNEGSRVLEPLAYVYRTASNVLAEFHARKRREPVQFDSEALADAAENPLHIAPDELADRLSTERELQRVLAALPQAYRDILVMRLRDGRSYHDIAKRLGLSVHTAEKYFFRALAKVRNANWD